LIGKPSRKIEQMFFCHVESIGDGKKPRAPAVHVTNITKSGLLAG
jgi:hypothetical protein